MRGVEGCNREGPRAWDLYHLQVMVTLAGTLQHGGVEFGLCDACCSQGSSHVGGTSVSRL